mgnify:CR=1 FL=1
MIRGPLRAVYIDRKVRSALQVMGDRDVSIVVQHDVQQLGVCVKLEDARWGCS